MRNKLIALFAAGLLGFATVSCDKYTEDLDITVSSDVIKYSVLVQVQDAKDGIPEDLQISVVGEDAEYIYDIAGNKDLVMNGGTIALGVHPKHEPTQGKPIKFTVMLSGSGYLDSSFPVTINKDEFSQMRTVKVVKLTNAPSTVAVETKTVTLAANGTSLAPIVLNTTATTDIPVQTEVVVPANTQFQAADGTPLVGGTLSMRVINFNSASPSSIELFPGGSLLAEDITGPNGVKEGAVFLPAGFAQINMSVAGNEVKKFSQPISVSMELNPGFIKPNSTTPIAAGDKLDIFSYSESSGKWTYEKEATVAMVNGKPAVSFTTNHLTIFSALYKVPAVTCSGDPAFTLNFDATWLGDASKLFEYRVKLGNFTILSGEALISNGSKFNFPVPLSISIPVVLELYSNGVQFASTSLSGFTCGSNTQVPVAIAAPARPVTNVKLSLKVKCPNKNGADVTVQVPPFYLQYRSADSSGKYEILGQVKNGNLKTTELEIGKRYDFYVELGGSVKYVEDYLIDKAHMSTTAGFNDDLGTGQQHQEYNKTLLIDFCNQVL